MSANGWLIVSLALLALLGTGALVWASRVVRCSEFARARKLFHTQREYLEAKFLEMAGSSGKPRGLEWAGCEFDSDVAYARDRQSGQLTALVGVTIRFTAIPGGGMEEVEAVSNLRAATAVFRYRAGVWSTEGRTIFNLNPTEAIHHFQSSLVMVGREGASRA